MLSCLFRGGSRVRRGRFVCLCSVVQRTSRKRLMRPMPISRPSARSRFTFQRLVAAVPSQRAARTNHSVTWRCGVAAVPHDVADRPPRVRPLGQIGHVAVRGNAAERNPPYYRQYPSAKIRGHESPSPLRACKEITACTVDRRVVRCARGVGYPAGKACSAGARAHGAIAPGVGGD